MGAFWKSGWRWTRRAVVGLLTAVLIIALIGAFAGDGPERSSTLRLTAPSTSQWVVTASDEGMACSIPGVVDWAISRSGSEEALVVEQFRQACIQHDFCYRYGHATYSVRKSECDRDLYTHIRSLCTQITKKGLTRRLCGSRAALTYAGVLIGGIFSYRENGYWHDYDARPAADRIIEVPRALRPSGSTVHVLALARTGETPGLRVWRWDRETLSFAATGEHHWEGFSPSAPLAWSEIPQVVKLVQGDRLVYTPSPRALFATEHVSAQRPGLGEYPLWIGSFDLTAPAPVFATTSSAGARLGGEEDTLHMPAMVDDFDGDGDVEAVYIGRSRTAATPAGCTGGNDYGRGSTYLSVETLAESDSCYSISVLNEVAGVDAPNSKKYRKFQYSPLAGNFVAEPAGVPRRLEILLVYREAQSSDLLHGWLLQQQPCKAGESICWRASPVSPCNLTLGPEFLPLVVLPAPASAAAGVEALDMLAGVDWTRQSWRANGTIEVRRITLEAASETGYRFVQLPATKTEHAWNADTSHSPIALTADGRLGVFAQMETLSTSVVRASLVTLRLSRAAIDAKPYVCTTSAVDTAQWPKFPLLTGDFDGDGTPDAVFVDRTNPADSLLFSLQGERFVPQGRRSRELCGEALPPDLPAGKVVAVLQDPLSDIPLSP